MPGRQRLPSSEVNLSSSPTSPHQRSSLRRLSSLANLNQFNPFSSFSRRRSSHGTQTSDEDPYLINTYQQSQHRRRQSYVSLSENPVPALPKSRTFSNLPVTKSRHASKPRTSLGPPPSRILTPSTGFNAKSRLASATKSILKVGNRRPLVRSDTEPLLAPRLSPVVPAQTRPHKENVALKVSKPERKDVPFQLPGPPVSLPKAGRSTNSFNMLKQQQTQAGQITSTPIKKESPELCAPRTLVAKLSSEKSVLSPSVTASKPRRRTMLAPTVAPLRSAYESKAQRFSFGSDVQSHQLLGPRGAPTPPPHSRRSTTSHILNDDTNKTELTADCVTSAQTTAYWTGRLMAQFDRRRNEQLQACMFTDELSPSYPENDLNLCLTELQKKCVTEAAKLSFAMFKAKLYIKAGISVANKAMPESGGKDMVEA